MQSFSELVQALAVFPTATIHEAMGQRGAMTHDMRAVYPGARVCGPAVTVQCPPGDNLTIHHALAESAPGSVLVVSMGGHLEGGCFGEIAAVAAHMRGMIGLVCDGAVRDIDRFQALDFPVYARGVSMKGTSKVKLGTINEAIVCAGVLVAPGDVIVADADGVVAVPAGEVAEVIQAARAKEEAEQRIMDRIRAGELTVDVLGLINPNRSTKRGASA